MTMLIVMPMFRSISIGTSASVNMFLYRLKVMILLAKSVLGLDNSVSSDEEEH